MGTLATFSATFDSDLENYTDVKYTVYDGTTGSPSSGCAKISRPSYAAPSGDAAYMNYASTALSPLPADVRLNYRYRFTGMNLYSDGNTAFQVYVSTSSSGFAYYNTVIWSDLSSSDTGWLQATEIDLSAFAGEDLDNINFEVAGYDTGAPGSVVGLVYIDTITLTEGSPAAGGSDFQPSQAGIPFSILVA